MRNSSRDDLKVFDFKEDDEIIESASAKYMGKFGNAKAESSDITKYQFLECFARGTDVEQVEIINISPVDVVSPVDVDANERNEKCSNSNSYALVAEVGDEISTAGAVLLSNSMSRDRHDFSPGKLESENEVLRLNSLPAGALRLGSAGIEQFRCTLPESSSDNQPVDVISDDDQTSKESSPSTSDFSENDDSLEERASDHYFHRWQMDNINVTVAVFPDYVICGDRFFTDSVLSFSCDCIKLEGSTAYRDDEAFSIEWATGDVVSVESYWCERVEIAIVNLCFKSEDVAAENAVETSGIEELKFAVADRDWSEKQEKIISQSARLKAVWNVVLDEDAVLGQSSVFPSKRYLSNFDEPFEDVIYPRGDPDAVSISKRDVELLLPETFINDTIIDFYIKYLKNKIPQEEKHRFHFFNSFFFRKLADLDKDPISASEGRAAFLRVRKWTRKVNLFEKDYIFIPVNFNLHWSLIVVCHPGEIANFKNEEIDKSTRVPCILHMDSIKGSHKGLKNLVQSYLWEEWKERQKETPVEVSSKFNNLRFVPLELPQQENSFDCGLFLLHYVELFLEEAPVNFSPFKIMKSSHFLNMDWFPPAEASLKRAFIQKLIFEIIEDYSQEIPPNACGDELRASEFSEINIEKETGVEVLVERQSPANIYHGTIPKSSSDQGIEMTLLATSPLRDEQCVRDSGMVFREFFEPETNAGSIPEEENRALDERASFSRIKGIMSPTEEDRETGEQFSYLPTSKLGCQQLDGTKTEVCTTSYASKDFSALQISWNPGISMQEEEHEDRDSSAKKSICGSHNTIELGVDDHSLLTELEGLHQLEKQDKTQSPPLENIGSGSENPAPESGGNLESCVVEDSQEADEVPDSNESDCSSSSQENPDTSSGQKVCLAEKRRLSTDDMQLSSDDVAYESDEQQGAKRQRLIPPSEGLRRFTRSLSKDLNL